MAENRFIQNANLFSYSGINCIRNDYFYNDCHICVEICPENAFRIIRNRLTLYEDECIECAACIGSCPTEALGIKSFDPNAFVASVAEKETVNLTCKKNTPCLGVFDQHHFITIALDVELSCDMSHCNECALNVEGKVEAFIRSNIAKTDLFFEKSGIDYKVAVIEEKEEENARRALFRAAIEKAKERVSDESPITSMTQKYQKKSDASEPLKYLQLKSAIKKHLSRFKRTKFDTASDLFFDKSITFEACTNCGECIQFCPTDALRATSDKQGIMLTAGHCIGCGICDHICKTDAIFTKEAYDLVTIAYERSEVLVHFDMVMCYECRCPYPYRGGDPICDRCKDFKDNFGSMFVLAKEISSGT